MKNSTISLDEKQRVIIVSRRLPFKVCQNEDDPSYFEIQELQADALTSAAHFLRKQGFEVVFVGTYDCKNHLSESEIESLDRQLWEEHKAKRVPLSPRDFDLFYKGFCKSILWPLFHYLRNKAYEDESWTGYKTANHAFVDIISQVYRAKDINQDLLWIHDYHLLVLPQLLRERLGDSARIGFFLHSPFPSSEAYRCLPVREDLLKSVTHADYIGFQTYNFSRHFTNTLGRLIGVDAENRGLFVNNRHVEIGILPTGIDLDQIEQMATSPSVLAKSALLRHQFGDKIILVARCKMDGIQGIPQLLQGYEEFLQKFSADFNHRVVLILISEPATEGILETDILLSQVNERVGAINGKYGKVDFMPIHFSTQDVDLEEIYALYRIADAILITPVRDGMNLTPHEFVACQQFAHHGTAEQVQKGWSEDSVPGTVILSELAGSAQSLSGVISINPYDVSSIALAMNEALTMSANDRHVRHLLNYRYVSRYTIQQWARNCIDDLIRVNTSADPLSSLSDFSNMKQGQQIRLEDLKTVYSQSMKKRLFLLDYDGTLVGLAPTPDLAGPTQELLTILRDLGNDENNIVYVVSGRDKHTFEKWLADLPVGLSCEHGLFLRHPGKQDWEDLLAQLDLSWKEIVFKILEDYTDRTPGSFIETKVVNLTWHYRNAHPEFGALQAKSLAEHLKTISLKMNFEVLIGKKAIELRPRGIDKGSVVKKLVSMYQDDISMMVCIGDDKTDEDMFDVMNSMYQQWKAVHPELHQSYTIKVGAKPSKADYYVKQQPDVVTMLRSLSTCKLEK